MDNSLEALAGELRPALLRIYRQLRRESEPPGLSLLQNILLGIILKHPGITIGELAEMERLRGPTMSGHIKQLEADGLVERAPPDPADRRRVGLTVTAQGKALLQAVKRQRTDWLAQQLQRLSPEGQQAIRAAIAALHELGQ
ncbi:MAG TPA: MarR family transcriptional regulator [Aliidongia sp.]|nr:MarR family transcriptional regulator [Aliidongia sp.]